MRNTPWTIEWSDELSMHNQEIDAEHKHFIQMVNEFNHEVTSKQHDKNEIVRIMGFILEDAAVHFANEELLFVENHFPLAMEHAEIHEQLLNKLEGVLKELKASNYSQEWVDLGGEIKNALIDHILNHDTQYIDYLRTE
ncbi:hypothetical protein FEF65_11285 [Mariprofundus erugo]|uniref:Hemerythrin-like domain-containing protein n=1 Tax=Mariprofundus erugo TaxID=2528639 RepID=A0A5R9GK42_9PROT|nr:hemerythrin domain-containing protein [Mariprofundus erugo]TLS66168.1 hypothetical protein FEF65_11285 [Mariprofundus erugo]